MSLIFVKLNKEYVYRRRAVKKYFCRECHEPILVGEHYVEDHVSCVFRRRRIGEGYIRWRTDKICENCWRAPLNV